METKECLGARYRLERRLATGGMGDVWVARDELLGRRVALKLLHPHLAADDEFRRRFRAEAQAAARLSHPGIVGIFDYGEESDVAYLAMELVDGESLSSVLGRGKLGPGETMSLVAQAADALATAHREGLVHRDVKPANLLLRPDGRVKVTDFGIVRASGVATMTHDGTVLGTVAYMSPEQVRGERVTAASDIYSLGVVAYECLTGRRPYSGDDSIAVALAHLQEPVPELPTSTPASVRELVTAMLQKDVSKRPASAAAVAGTARRLAGALPGAGPADTGRNGRRRPAPVADRSTTRANRPVEATVDRDASAARRTEALGPGGAVDAGESAGGTTQGLDLEPLALAGIAREQTAALPALAAPVVVHNGRRRRESLRIALVALVALVVALVLSTAFSGSSRAPAAVAITVPQLHGMTLKRAERHLVALGLHWTTVGPSNPSPDDVVAAQSPTGGTRVHRGAVIRLTVTTPTPPTSPPTTAPPPVQPPPGHGPPGPGGTGDGTGPPGHGQGHGH